jgi:hypothetical protein
LKKRSVQVVTESKRCIIPKPEGILRLALKEATQLCSQVDFFHCWPQALQPGQDLPLLSEQLCS